MLISGVVDVKLNLGGMINKFDFSELMHSRFACIQLRTLTMRIADT